MLFNKLYICGYILEVIICIHGVTVGPSKAWNGHWRVPSDNHNNYSV